MDGLEVQVNDWPFWNVISFDKKMSIRCGGADVSIDARHVYATDETETNGVTTYQYQGKLE